MSGKLTRAAYEELIAEDIAWLETAPRTLERDHIIMVLEASPGHEYGPRASDELMTRPEIEQAIADMKKQRERIDDRIWVFEGKLRP